MKKAPARKVWNANRLIACWALSVAFFAAVISTSAAQTPEAAIDPFLGMATIPLWPGQPPFSKREQNLVDVPTLTVFRPLPGTENGTAVIIAPGGGYLFLSSNLEGRQVADWFAARGVTAYVLRYRLGATYLFPIPLLDAQRAVRLVRSSAKESLIRPNRIGFVGFSAGGHLAALVGTKGDPGDPQASDIVDRESSKPDFLVLGYPWINAMQPAINGMITYCSLLPSISAGDCRRFDTLYTPLNFVTRDTPPTYIFSTSDDAVVPVTASENMYAALRSKGVSAELHIFRHGAHGGGLGKGDPALELWPALLENWLRDQGWLTPDPSITEEASRPTQARLVGQPLTVSSRIQDILADPAGQSVLERHLGPNFALALKPAQLQSCLQCMSTTLPALLTPVSLRLIDRELAIIR